MRAEPWPFLVTACFLLGGCGQGLPSPGLIAHRQSALRVVPYPPPPARVELVPEQPQEGAVWVDGNWVWRGRRWVWRYGQWVEPLAGVRWAPNVTARNKAAVLYYAEGQWLTESQERPETLPRVLATGQAREATVVDEIDVRIDTGPNAQPRGARKSRPRPAPPSAPEGSR
jgi:hypothetical protein